MSFRDHWRSVEVALLGRGLAHFTIEPFATYSPWLNDEDFQTLLHQIQNKSLVDIYRLWELKQLSEDSASVPGDVLEVGVWKGGSGALLCTFNPGKKVWLADTFSGVVNESSRDLSYNGGEHADTSVEEIYTLFNEIGLSNFEVLKGEFPSDTGDLVPRILSVVHIDVDVYESAKQIWNYVKPLMSSGGVVIFDDYGFSSTDGVTSFVNEIRNEKDFRFIYNLNGHGIFIKI